MLFSLRRKPEDNLLTTGSIFFLLCVALFAYTGQYWIIGIPFVAATLCWMVLHFKAFYWFFIFTIPLSATIYFFHESLSTTVPDEPIMWLLLIVSVCVAAYNYKVFPRWYFRHPFTLIITLQIVWLVVAVIFSRDIALSLKYFAAKLWFLNAYFLLPVFIFREKKDFKKVFLIFVIPTTLHAVFAFCWHYKVHFDYWLSNVVVRPFYQNHVDYSTVLSMLFPLLITAYQLCKGRKGSRLLLAATILFYIPAIYFAAARAAILGVFFALFIAFMVRRRKVQYVMPIFYLLIACGIMLLAHRNKFIDLRPDKKYTATQPTFIDAVTGAFTGTDMSSMERFYRWIAALRMSRERPVTGVGPNNFYDYYKPYTINMFSTWVSRNPERSTTHNYFLLMLVEQGWPAMILYAILVMAVFVRGQKIYSETEDPFYKRVTMGLIMMFAAGFVNNFFSELLETHKVGALFYLSIALLIIIDRLNQKDKQATLYPGK